MQIPGYGEMPPRSQKPTFSGGNFFFRDLKTADFLKFSKNLEEIIKWF